MNLDELSDDEPAAKDFRRANGAPLVRSLDGKKWDRYARPSGFGHDLDDESALQQVVAVPCYRGCCHYPLPRRLDRRPHRPERRCEGSSGEGDPDRPWGGSRRSRYGVACDGSPIGD